MLKQIKFLIFITGVFLFFTACGKEYSYENGGTQPGVSIAAFSLASTLGNCTDVFVNGTYMVGTPLTPGNTIGITVMVDSIGYYSISTNTNNGVSFSASGSFTSTGEQTINLSGSGTPVSAGSIEFTIDNNGCAFSVEVENRPPGTAVFTYDGAPSSCTNISRGGAYTAGVPLTDLNVVKIDVNVVVTGTYSISTPVVNGFSFYGTGLLETMGYGIVTLTGTGTPIAAGTFSFTPSNNGCPFPIFVAP
jgi:hypothetical protein